MKKSVRWLCSLLLSLYCIMLLSCESPSARYEGKNWTEIRCREGSLLYRAIAPSDWQRKEFTSDDTTVPICTFMVAPGLELHIHTFPWQSLKERIPPQAQVARWEKQLSPLLDKTVTPISHGGFAGLYLEAETAEKKMLAWSMQLAPVYFALLEEAQPKADYTIKIVGPRSLVEKHQREIELFAASFELIQELPYPI